MDPQSTLTPLSDTENSAKLYRNHPGAYNMKTYYERHVMAMTAEALHDKGDIAAELAWRDMKIQSLVRLLDNYSDQLRINIGGTISSLDTLRIRLKKEIGIEP